MKRGQRQIWCPFDLCRIDRPLTMPTGTDDRLMCPNTNKLLPDLYLRQGIDAPTDVVTTVGRRASGKSTFLMAMLGTLILHPGLLSERASIGTYSARDDRDDRGSLAWARDAYSTFMSQGRCPDATDLSATPVPFYIADCPPNGRLRNLFMFENGGEAFTDVGQMELFAQPTAQAEVVWLFVSLNAEGQAEVFTRNQFGSIGANIWDLVNSYNGARVAIRSNAGLPWTPQALLVIFTKADARGPGVLPELSLTLERGGVLSTPADRATTSQAIRNWLATYEEGEAEGGLAVARNAFARVEFCAVSATGCATDGQQTKDVLPNPQLVLDPLAWTWELTDWISRNRSRLIREERRRHASSPIQRLRETMRR